MEKTDIEKEIQRIIKEKINPILNEHMGGVVLRDYSNGVVTVKFTGNCGSCMAASDTLENIVKTTLFEELPQIEDVVLDTSVDQDLLDFAKRILSGDEEKNGCGS